MSKRPCHSDNGDRFWSNKQGFLHRIHGPAMEDVDGFKRWLRDGLDHREGGGDAIEDPIPETRLPWVRTTIRSMT